MRVAVITPYHREVRSYLEACHRSVSEQTHDCRHVMVADGNPDPVAMNWDADHIVLPYPHDDIGSTPRAIGALHAIGAGFDAVAFLDADNWYAPDHIAALAGLHYETGAAILTASRHLCRLDGSVMATCPHSNGEDFVDTSCMMLMRPAFHLASKWALLPPYAHLIGDRIMLHYMKESGLPRVHLSRPTVFYRCGKAGIYRDLGEPIPEGVMPRPDYGAAFARWEAEGNPSVRPHPRIDASHPGSHSSA
jgi:glycosyltransferase involved in cell wall biosynthesis